MSCLNLMETTKFPSSTLRRPKRVRTLEDVVSDCLETESELKCTYNDILDRGTRIHDITSSGGWIPRGNSYLWPSFGEGPCNTWCWNTCGRGDSSNPALGGDTRIGDRVKERRLSIMLHLIQEYPDLDDTASDHFNIGCSVRIIVIRENNWGSRGLIDLPDFNKPDIAEVLHSPPFSGDSSAQQAQLYWAQRNWLHRKQFTVLYDQIHPLVPRQGFETRVLPVDPTGLDFYPLTEAFVNINLDLDRDLTYIRRKGNFEEEDGWPSTWDLQSGGIFVWAQESSSKNNLDLDIEFNYRATVQARGSCAFYYEDP